MRQKITKMLLSMMLAVVCVLNMGITVCADAEYDSGMTKEEVIAKYTVDTGNEQADKVFNQYLEVASDMMVDEKYSTYIKTVEIGDSLYRTYYCLYAGGTEEEWNSKTTFEKILWQELYIYPLVAIAENSYESALGTLDSFLYTAGEITQDVYSRYDVVLAEAYLKIMEWQYYYIIENNAVYNFMTGEDSLGRTEIAEVPQFTVEESVEVEPSEENIEVSESGEVVEEGVEPQATEAPKSEEEKGIWDDFIQSLKEKWLTFSILVVLVVALVGVIIYRKSKGVDDDKVA